MTISLIDIEELMPEKIVPNEYFGEEEVRQKNRMFAGTKERRHMGRDENASDYLAKATLNLCQRLKLEPKNIDMILTNVSLPDEAFTGCGAVINKKINGNAKIILDLHNTGCVSFIYLLELAETYMNANKTKNAIICLAQTAAGRVFGQEDTRQLAQAAIPGDGFAVAYVDNTDARPILTIEYKNYPQHSEDMYGNFNGKKWWESRTSSGSIDFNENKSALIMARGNKAVPEMIQKVCKNIGIKTTDLNYLITNQPNKIFLRNWHEAIQMKSENHLNTFEKYANLFGAGIPVTMAEAIKENKFKSGDIVCLAGFSHACDYSGAALIKW